MGLGVGLIGSGYMGKCHAWHGLLWRRFFRTSAVQGSSHLPMQHRNLRVSS